MELEVSSNLQWKAVRYLVRYQVHFPFWTAKHGFGQTVGVVRMLLRCLGIPEFNLSSRILFRSKLELMEGCDESDGKREKRQRQALAGTRRFRRTGIMKTWGSWAKVVASISVVALVGGLLMISASRHAGKNSLQSKGAASLAATSETARPSENSRWIKAYGNLPLSFEENRGQTAREVRYISHGSGYELFLTPQEAVLALRSPVHVDLSPRNLFATLRALRDARRAHQATTTAVLRMGLEGTNPESKVIGIDKMPGKVNYFIGNDPKKWQTDVPTYAQVKYAEVYPGVDLVFYGNQRRLEYDFIVAPGADPSVIALKVDGARKMRVDAHGDLVLSVVGGEVKLQRPIIYQQVKGRRREISGKYALAAGHRVTFSVAPYDRSEPLVLDPVLNYSTYLGGNSDDMAAGIAVDSNGNAFIAGTTFSTTFPTTSNAYIPEPLAANGGTSFATFVSELNPAGTQLLYSTYLAGSTPGEFAFGIAVDPADKVYVTGFTLSTDFPTSNSANPTFIPGFKLSPNAGNVNGTSFLAKFDPTQSTGAKSFVYSSYISGTNGTNGELGHSVAVADSSGVVYVAGVTDSTAGAGLANFPVVNGFQTALSTANGNAFLTKIDTTTSAAPVYSTYLGGNDANSAAAGLGFGDAAFGVAVDSSGNAYLIGETTSTDFSTFSTVNPALKGFDLTYPAGNTTNTVFVSRIDTTKTAGASLAYLTYLGGAGSDFGDAIALGPAPNNLAYVTGQTGSSSFPIFPVPGPGVPGPFQTTKGAFGVAFVSLIDTTTSANPSYSTFLGGTGSDEGLGIRVDAQGNAYIAGKTQSRDFPHSQGAILPAIPASATGSGFVSKISPSGNGQKDLLYSSFFGGDGSAPLFDQATGIAIDSSNNVYITGQTYSTASSFPVFPPSTAATPAFQTSLNSTSDAFIAKLTLLPTLAVSPTSINFGLQPVGVTSAAQTVTLTNNTSDAIPFLATSVSFTGTNAADFASPSNTCGASIAAAASCTVGVTFTPSGTPLETATLVITVTITDGGVSGPQSFDVSLQGTGSASAPGVGLAPTSLAFGNQVLNTTSAAQTVTLTNTGNAALTINSIAASGDFAATSTGANACPISPATLSATAGSNTCVISVTFKPTALGARAGTLTVTDNAGGSPHTVGLTGTGTGAADFGLTAPTSVQNVTDGQTLMFNVTVTGVNGFNSPVALACTGAPTLAVCTVTSPVTPPVAPPSSVQAQVSMTTKAFVVPSPNERTPPLSPRQVVPLILAFLLLLSLRWARRPRMRLAMAGTVFLLIAFAGCSGPAGPHTPKGPATLTITGTSGALQHTVQVQIAVN
jgi:hypothetical protein